MEAPHSMGYSEKDIARFGPAARRQIMEQLAQASRQKIAARPKPQEDFGSELERRYYEGEIWPRVLAGEIVKVEKQKTFLLLPADEYDGIKLHKAEYTPDFILTYADGTVEVVEVKSRAVRKLQGSYVYRRRLFIDKYARPSGWRFTEAIY